MNFSDVVMKPSITDIPLKRASENNLRHQNVAEAVEKTAIVSKQLSDNHLDGPVSAEAGAGNFEIVIGKNFKGQA